MYEKFDKNDYTAFVKENFETIFNNKIKNLRDDFIINKKKTINKCLINTSISNYSNPKKILSTFKINLMRFMRVYIQNIHPLM